MAMAEPDAQGDTSRNWITVARILRTQGRRGEVAAEILTDFPERFATGARFHLAGHSGTPAELRQAVLEDAWFHKGQVILKFAGVDSISDAERLAGLGMLIPASQRMPLPGGSYYLGDLIDCQVVQAGRVLGRVADWEDTGGGILLHVEPVERGSSGAEILIPFAAEICTAIDVAGRRIEVRLPEGLMELNAGSDGQPAAKAKASRKRDE